MLGGLVLNWLSWRWLFLINVPVGIVGLVLGMRWIPNDIPAKQKQERIDIVGAFTVIPALTGMLLGLPNIRGNAGIGRAEVSCAVVCGYHVSGSFRMVGPAQGK